MNVEIPAKLVRKIYCPSCKKEITTNSCDCGEIKIATLEVKHWTQE